MLVTIDIGKEWTVLKKASANRAYRLATVDTYFGLRFQCQVTEGVRMTASDES